MITLNFGKLKYKFIKRILDIFYESLWSNLDALFSLIILGIGIYLINHNDMFLYVGDVYSSMAKIATEIQWGIFFILSGGFGLVIALWGNSSLFIFRLLSRMFITFCMLILAGNNFLYKNPPLSTITYIMLSCFSFWGILRVK